MIASHEDKLRVQRFRDARNELMNKHGMRKLERKTRLVVSILKDSNLKPANFVDAVWTAVNIYKARTSAKHFDLIIMAGAYEVIRNTTELREFFIDGKLGYYTGRVDSLICLTPDVFENFRSVAITDPTKLEVGKTYYSNMYPEVFTIEELQTENEHNKDRGLALKEEDSDEPRWIKYDHRNGYGPSYISTRDRNMGAKYNCWLVFDDEHLAAAAKKMIVVSENPKFDKEEFYKTDWQ